jgi:hypothetical protein
LEPTGFWGRFHVVSNLQKFRHSQVYFIRRVYLEEKLNGMSGLKKIKLLLAEIHQNLWISKERGVNY